MHKISIIDADCSDINFIILIKERNSKCFDVSMYKPTREFGWSLGKCFGSRQWLGSGTYTDKCCILEEMQILSCNITSHNHRDWSSTTLTMLGHHFCDDFAGHNAFISINVTGANIYDMVFTLCIY